MPWNEPGKNNNNDNNNQDPWNGKRNNPNPPDLDKLISDLFRKIRLFLTQKKNNSGNSDNRWQPAGSKELRYGVGLCTAIIVFLWFLSGFFIVNPAEETVKCLRKDLVVMALLSLYFSVY